MQVYNLRNRKTGRLYRTKHWSAIGQVKSTITRSLEMFKEAEYDLIVYELKEIQAIPITQNNDFNRLMYHTLEMEKKKNENL
jgi:hypothetical protein